MEIFETALENFSFLGMEWDENSQKFLYNIKKSAVTKIVSITCFIFTLLFLMYDAQSFDEYTEALFVCSTSVMCSIITTAIYIKLDMFSKFTKMIKRELNRSK